MTIIRPAIMVAEVRAHLDHDEGSHAESFQAPLAFVAGARCPLLPGVFVQPVVYNGPPLAGLAGHECDKEA
jgi:hypothetical protein